jgi:hypothetical protein
VDDDDGGVAYTTPVALPATFSYFFEHFLDLIAARREMPYAAM